MALKQKYHSILNGIFVLTAALISLNNLRSAISFIHFSPIDKVEESANIIGPAVLIVQVVGMFPYI